MHRKPQHQLLGLPESVGLLSEPTGPDAKATIGIHLAIVDRPRERVFTFCAKSEVAIERCAGLGKRALPFGSQALRLALIVQPFFSAIPSMRCAPCTAGRISSRVFSSTTRRFSQRNIASDKLSRAGIGMRRLVISSDIAISSSLRGSP